jgi:hypothetical protein
MSHEVRNVCDCGLIEQSYQPVAYTKQSKTERYVSSFSLLFFIFFVPSFPHPVRLYKYTSNFKRFQERSRNIRGWLPNQNLFFITNKLVRVGIQMQLKCTNTN